MEILSKDDILLLPPPPESACGVYFLIKDSEIVYVGSAVNIPSRVEFHLYDRSKAFDRVSHIPTAVSSRCAVEKKYIKALKPPLNKVNNPDYKPSRFDEKLVPAMINIPESMRELYKELARESGRPLGDYLRYSLYLYHKSLGHFQEQEG